MFTDTFDKITWLLLAVVIAALAGVLATNHGAGAGRAAGLGKAVEREMAYRARVELLARLYGPVEELRTAGNDQEALLRLNELIRSYPGEAHGYILRGEILRKMGALDEAVASFEEGVRLNGDYVDAQSPLSRRRAIEGLVAEGLAGIGGRAAANPGNRSLAASLRKVNYLKSRLAGGCE